MHAIKIIAILTKLCYKYLRRMALVGRSGRLSVPFALIMMAGLTAAMQDVKAEMYGYQDGDGTWRFPSYRGDRREDPAGPRKAQEDPVPVETYQHIIREASEKFGVEGAFIKAVIQAESDFRRGAVSPKGAEGLMQLMPPTRARMGAGNPFNPRENIYGGTRYLAGLLKRFGQDKALALAAYNAGPERVETSGGIPPVPETRAFVSRALEYYDRFRLQAE